MKKKPKRQEYRIAVAGREYNTRVAEGAAVIGAMRATLRGVQ